MIIVVGKTLRRWHALWGSHNFESSRGTDEEDASSDGYFGVYKTFELAVADLTREIIDNEN